MNEDRLNELLERCQSPIERQLLENLYPHLTTARIRELRAQHKIDCYDDMPLTIPDFVFPDMRIAIYCDSFAWHAGNPKIFKRDRSQSRELQLRGWIVLRFAGSEINRNSAMVIDTVQRAIARRERRQAWWEMKEQPILVLHSGQDRQRLETQQKPGGGMCGVVFLTFVIVGIVVLLNFIF